MNEADFVGKARTLVYNYARTNLDPTDQVGFDITNVYFVSMTGVLGCWKAMLSTALVDGMYYEVVYDARIKTFHMIAYRRWAQITAGAEDIKDETHGA